MLTKQDLETLIEAVEAWERTASNSAFTGALVGAMVCRSQEEFEKHRGEREREMLAAEQKTKVLKERGVMLRAKLIQMRDSAEAQSFLDRAAR